jgi:hypothetical protein
MRKFKRQTENIDDFIIALEELMHAKDDMYEENKFQNRKEILKIKEKRYDPAKKKVKSSLERIVSDLINY